MSKARQHQTRENLDSPYEGRIGLVYARVSSKKQDSQGSGLYSQEGRCIAELTSLGVPHEKTFYDKYTGGGDFMQRPAMRELLAYIDAHPYQKFVIIFDDLKRFARDTIFHLKLRSALKGRDVLPRCLNYNFDDSPEGMFVETVLAAGNELERHQNQRQTVQKMKARLDAGYWPFAARKGYKMIDDPTGHGKISVPSKIGLEILAPALLDFASGKLSRKIDVCRYLVERGFWSKQSPEKYIDKLTDMLQDCFYCGQISYPKWEVSRRPGKHIGLISIDTYERIQNRLHKGESGVRVRSDRSEDFPLRGLLVCRGCGKHITGAWSFGYKKQGYAYYYCQTKGCAFKGKTCPKDDVEKDFKLLLKETALRPQAEEFVNVVFDDSWQHEMSEVEAVERRKTDRKDLLERKVRDLSDMARQAKSESVRGVYETQIEEAIEEIEGLGSSPAIAWDLETPYRNALSKSITMLKNPIDIWDYVDTAEKNRLFFFIFLQKLPYDRIEGYRNAETLSTTRLFGAFVAENPAMCG